LKLLKLSLALVELTVEFLEIYLEYYCCKKVKYKVDKEAEFHRPLPSIKLTNMSFVSAIPLRHILLELVVELASRVESMWIIE
jgi:hypothetical protein